MPEPVRGWAGARRWLGLGLGFALALLLAAAGAVVAQTRPAVIEVLLPDTDVELKLDDRVVRAPGRIYTVVTPPLEPGQAHRLTIEATLVPNVYTKVIRTREVTVRAGETVSLDLGPARSQPGDDVRISWVPTPETIVIEMGRLAGIGPGDVVYDLGCGDGIMIITAVKKMGAGKGVGIDVDPQRVAEARANARSAGVEDRIEIREGNILTLDPRDVADASVVMLYLGDEMNRQLRSYLWRALKPGTRIVSHRFEMDDWTPEKTVSIGDTDGERYVLHRWTVTGKEKEGHYPRTAAQ